MRHALVVVLVLADQEPLTSSTALIGFGLDSVVESLAALGFLGLGAEPPSPEWGSDPSRGVGGGSDEDGVPGRLGPGGPETGTGLATGPRPRRGRAVHRPAAQRAQFATAIDLAFGRWDPAHLHLFTMSDGTRVSSLSREPGGRVPRRVPSEDGPGGQAEGSPMSSTWATTGPQPRPVRGRADRRLGRRGTARSSAEPPVAGRANAIVNPQQAPVAFARPVGSVRLPEAQVRCRAVGVGFAMDDD